MGLFGFLKGMRIEDHDPLDITLRTTRTNCVLGSLLILTGICLAGRSVLHVASQGLSLLGLFGVGLAGGFALTGLALLAYRKCVILAKNRARIEYMEYGLLCQKRATFHFCDVRQLEICRVAECVASSPVCMWAVKGYVRRGGGWEVVRFFESTRADGAEEVANLLSCLLNVQVIRESELSFEGPLPSLPS